MSQRFEVQSVQGTVNYDGETGSCSATITSPWLPLLFLFAAWRSRRRRQDQRALEQQRRALRSTRSLPDALALRDLTRRSASVKQGA